ncbi:hypothetical protein [Kluyvera intermedia]|uniref:Tail fiber assembly protein n=1 Tax=Kluyvera intermedia TaxID=61648 RepID=A0AA95G1T4_KLUIN|nr:hypothetical protein [Kluyvera intermedia]WGL57915.1 hypothetical protein QBD33_09245 [Kluyvera intermedia]
MNYAIVSNGIVENVIVCISDKEAKKLFPEYIVIKIGDVNAGIGWAYNGKEFIPPEIEISDDERARENLALADSEYSRATGMITALQEKIEDADYADGETESSVLDDKKAWTEYRKELRAYIKTGDGSVNLPKLIQ